jgi:hypothetical protein
MYVLRQNPTKYIDTITFQSTEEVLRRSIDNQGASTVYAKTPDSTETTRRQTPRHITHERQKATGTPVTEQNLSIQYSSKGAERALFPLELPCYFHEFTARSGGPTCLSNCIISRQ